MRTEPYSKSKSPRRQSRVGLVRGAGNAEVVVLGAALVAGIGVGFALDSLFFGFIALIVLALIARLVLAVIGMDGDTGSNAPAPAHSHEHAGS